MANNTFAVLLDEEVKNKFNTFIQSSGQTTENFVAQLIALYEIQLKRDSVSEVNEFEHFRNGLTRIEEIIMEYKKFTQHRRIVDETKISELNESLQQSKTQFLDMQKQVGLIKLEAEENIRTIEVEANLTREDARREVQLMRDSLTRAEKTVAETEAKMEWLQTFADQSREYQQGLDSVKQEMVQAFKSDNQAEINFSQAQKDIAKKIKWQDLITQTKNEEEEKKKQAMKRAELEYKTIMETKRKAIDEMRQLQAKVKVDKEAPDQESATSNKQPRLGGFLKK